MDNIYQWIKKTYDLWLYYKFAEYILSIILLDFGVSVKFEFI